jgi:hypothetical protein
MNEGERKFREKLNSITYCWNGVTGCQDTYLMSIGEILIFEKQTSIIKESVLVSSKTWNKKIFFPFPSKQYYKLSNSTNAQLRTNTLKGQWSSFESNPQDSILRRSWCPWIQDYGTLSLQLSSLTGSEK